MKRILLALLAVSALAASLRLPRLAERPMHHDEANQAVRSGILLEEGRYEYDADDHHGPTLYYLTLPSAWLAGAKTFAETTETTYRLVPAVFGLLLVLCTPLLRRGLGDGATLCAALFAAVSPAMAYYGRFYIQETLLAFFTFLALASGWHSLRTGSRGWALACGLSAGLMFATKETAVIAFAAMAGAALLCALWSRRLHLPVGNMLLAAAAAIAVAIVLFSSFFTNPGGPLESILAFKGYVERGTGLGTDHVHPWSFYLGMLARYRSGGGPAWSEGLAFGLGLLGCGFILARRLPRGCDPGLARFLAFYTLLLTFAYSAIPYKTPWCLLSFLHGWILLAGIGTAGLIGLARRGGMPRLQSGIVLALLLAAAAGTYRLARRTVFRYAADHRNPYAYAHTAPDFMNLVRRIDDLGAASPKGRQLYIQVVAAPDQAWPLPFYLRRFPNVGYWTDPAAVPGQPAPDLVVSGTDYEADPDRYLAEYYGLRPDTLLALHIQNGLWSTFLETRAAGTPAP